MKKEFVYVVDNVFSPAECAEIIKTYQPQVNNVLPSGQFALLGDETPFAQRFYDVLFDYQKTFPGIHYTPSKWMLGNFKFHYYEKGKCFDKWHNEHCISAPHRILGMILYLTEHKTGTEFLTGGTIKSVPGRIAAFPCGFTHTHRGQNCPEEIDRFIISSYVRFYECGKTEIEWKNKAIEKYNENNERASKTSH